MKNFTHNEMTKHNPNIKELIAKLGWNGYGIFCGILDRAASEGAALRFEDMQKIADEMKIDLNDIKSVIKDFYLFEMDDKTFSPICEKKKDDKKIEIQMMQNGKMETVEVDRELVKAYEQYVGFINHSHLEELYFWQQDHGIENAKQAFKIAFQAGKATNLRYINGILNKAQENGYDWKIKEKKHDEKIQKIKDAGKGKDVERDKEDSARLSTTAKVDKWINDNGEEYEEIYKEAEAEVTESSKTIRPGSAGFPPLVRAKARAVVETKVNGINYSDLHHGRL